MATNDVPRRDANAGSGISIRRMAESEMSLQYYGGPAAGAGSLLSPRSMHSSHAFPPRLASSRICRLAMVAVFAACTLRGPAEESVGAETTAMAPGSRRDTVRVMVYNIHAGKDAAGVPNLDGIAALVRETRTDLALLQEVDSMTRRSGNVDQPAALAAMTGFHVAFGSALDYDGGEYGVAILSRWPVTRDTLVHLPVDPPQVRSGGSREPRGALRAEIAMPWGTLVVLNTHLDASGQDTWRRQEVRTLLELARQARAEHPNVLVGGDMNSTPESAVQEQVRAASLRDAFALCGRGTGLTFPSDSAIKRIDYLYLPDGISCVHAEVPQTRVSDHLPLLVDIIVPATPRR